MGTLVTGRQGGSRCKASGREQTEPLLEVRPGSSLQETLGEALTTPDVSDKVAARPALGQADPGLVLLRWTAARSGHLGASTSTGQTRDGHPDSAGGDADANADPRCHRGKQSCGAG